MNGSSLKVVAISDDALRSELLDALIVDESDYKTIVVESIPRAYTRIREVEPDLVVVFMAIDDPNACQLLWRPRKSRTAAGTGLAWVLDVRVSVPEPA